MPLVHSSSDKARQENIRREIEAGRPIKQAVAIGYSVQREAMHSSSDEREKQRHMHEDRKYGRE